MVFMTQVGLMCSSQFRNAFQLKNKTVLHWFPGHMGKGMKDMKNKLKSVDCVIETHDARIPLSGRNPNFVKSITGVHPHILLFNKRDLADQSQENTITSILKDRGMSNVLFTNCKDQNCRGIKKLFPLITELISSSNRYNRSEKTDYCVMVIGVPNVGKSSLINTLRNHFLQKSGNIPVGAKAGITRSVGNKVKICDDPLIYVYDTPGILTPSVPTIEVGMKLALCATIPDDQVGIEIVADYLLYWLNKHGNFRYIDYLGIEKPSDNITEVLVLAAIKQNKYVKSLDFDGGYTLRPNLHLAALNFVEGFRKGLYGNFTLDAEKIDSNVEINQAVFSNSNV